ncbi:MAG: hypothetical protein IKE81_04170, partial [Clostridia bacterium]|nr:hypothetical protein [Clostridia bacterium]
SIYVFDSGEIHIVVNHDENSARIPLETLLQLEADCSDGFENGVLVTAYPNTITIYRTWLPEKKRA